jgi:hypothetical protein
MKIHILIILLLSIILISCKGKQVGCMCEDGWVSNSNGRPGTCSHHGGIAYELYESDLEEINK